MTLDDDVTPALDLLCPCERDDEPQDKPARAYARACSARAMRKVGLTTTEIALALGVSRAAVHNYYTRPPADPTVVRVQRFWAKVEKDGPIPVHRPDLGPCWIWKRGLTSDGYGRAWFNGQPCNAHRVAYELLTSPIPEGLQLDHVCRVRCCVNPDHLEPVTNAENLRRGIHHHRAKTHCVHGHAYDEANTRVRPNGQRHCRACARVRDARRRAAA